MLSRQTAVAAVAVVAVAAVAAVVTLTAGDMAVVVDGATAAETLTNGTVEPMDGGTGSGGPTGIGSGD